MPFKDLHSAKWQRRYFKTDGQRLISAQHVLIAGSSMIVSGPIFD